MLRILRVVKVSLLAWVAAWPAGLALSAESFVAYQVPAGTVGNQAFNGAIGMDFDVLVDIEVTHLGVFDSGSDGLNLAIQARLYDRDSREVLALLDFSPGDDGEPDGGSRFKPLDPPLELPAGFRGSIVAEGYGASEPLGNGFSGPVAWTTDPDTCAIFFTNLGRYNWPVVPGAFPETSDEGPPNRYAAGTFRYRPLETPTPRAAIAYVVPAGTFGLQDFGGAVGMDFDVRTGIEVIRLGVFDSGSDGLFRTLTARLYDRDTKEALAAIEFTPEDPGILVEGSRWKDLEPSVLLPPGFRGSIVAEGYGAGELLANYTTPCPWFVDDGGCAILPVGTGRWGLAPGGFPENVDNGPANRYAAGTFEFKISQVVVEPPKPPTGLTAAASDGRVLLRWTAPVGGPPLEGYNVYQTAPGPRKKLNATPIAGTTFTAAGLLNGVAHCFEVISVSRDGLSSDPTEEVCATPSTTSVPVARTIAYEVTQGTAGNREDVGAVGLDFQTNARILITQLGVFDDGSDGLRAPIAARLFDTRTRALLASVEFTPADPGTLIGGSRFKPLPTAIELPPGFAATIAAEGYGPGERSGTTAIAPLSVKFQGGDCSLTALGARIGTAADPAGSFPTGFDPDNLYAAATFEYGLKPGEAPPPRDGGIAYVVPAGTAGTQDFPGALGMDFDVLGPVRILRLGVFDDRSDGLSLPITVRLYDRQSLAVLAQLEFFPGDDGELVGGSRFKELTKPLVLVPGFQGCIVASGYGGGELNGNAMGGQWPWSIDDGGCLLRFAGAGRWGTDPAGFPTNVDGGPPNRYAAGTFSYEPANPSEIPQPPTELTASGTPAGRVNLAWKPPAMGLAPEGYNVYRTSPPPVEKLNAVPLTALSFASEAFANGITACFVVRTVAGGLESAPSDEVCHSFPGGARRPGHFIAYEVPAGTLGNQPVLAVAGAVGMDFDAERAITVTRLGAFDDGGFGFRLPIVVRLYDRDAEEELASLEFAPGSDGDLIGGSRFKDLPSPLRLPAGFRGSIVAEGYGEGEVYGVAPGPWYVETGTCALAFVGTGRSGDAGLFPAFLETGPANRFAAGTFEFRPDEPVDPATQRGGTAYVVAAGTAGNQEYSGPVGMDFNANRPIRVTALGVFDDGSDGLSRAISARLYDRETRSVLARLEFTPEDPGELDGGSRFKPLDPPLELPAGFRGSIVAEGYGPGERNGNGFDGAVAWTTDDGGCVLSFVGSGRYSWPIIAGAFPTILDRGPPNRYAAGTFRFELSAGAVLFHRGDANGDGSINITDGIFILNYLFLGGAAPACLEAANANDDSGINITDGIYVLNYLFLGGPEPAPPGPPGSPCGPDPPDSASNEGCEEYAGC